MHVTKPRGNIVVNFFKGHIERKPDTVCLQSDVLKRKATYRFRARVKKRRRRTVLMHIV